jgi:GT2 family glycosyltransferase
MLTGEDLEMLCHIQKSGWEVWYNPEMEIYHKIPGARLKREYLIPFFRGIGLSRYVTRMTNVQPYYKPFVFVVYVINDLKKILLQLLKYGTNIRTDLVVACETELLFSSLISPFYLWKNGYFNKTSR